MNYSGPDTLMQETAGRRRLRFELIFASVLLGLGLFVLPAMIFGIGIVLLGPYGEAAGLGAFYVDFYRDLAEPSGRAWAIALGPLILFTLIRAVFLGARPEADRDAATRKEAPRGSSEHSRVEPRIGVD